MRTLSLSSTFNFQLLILLTLLLSACKDPVPPSKSFYYWKTVFRLNTLEREILAANNVNRLYLRYFDVVTGDNGPLPGSTIIFRDTLPPDREVIPVVFVVNDVLTGLSPDSVDMLAEQIYTRIEDISRAHSVSNIPELQMDCDWNHTTRANYFRLLTGMHERCKRSGKQLSATLRLYQLKYRKQSGIPPVDRVVLMCYNMGNLTAYGNTNSIIDAEEAGRYASGSAVYPLYVDIALPLFSWGVCFSGQQYRGLINGLTREDLQQDRFTEIAPDLYRADSALSLSGAYIRQGDHIRLEESSFEEIEKTVRKMVPHIKSPGYVIWYHLDSLLLQKRRNDEFQKIIDLFR